MVLCSGGVIEVESPISSHRSVRLLPVPVPYVDMTGKQHSMYFT